MSHAEPSPPAATPRRFLWRRLLQYRLRTLLILTTIVAFWLAWWSYHANRQRAAVAALRQHGALISYDFNKRPNIEVLGIYSSDPAMRPSYWPTWLIKILGVDYFATVEAVDFPSGATDSDLMHLQALPGLKCLELNRTSVADAEMEYIASLGSLQLLELKNTHITDAGLKRLHAITSLQWLMLDGTQITDVGIHQLHDLPALEVLSVGGTQVTDTGLKNLKALPRLRCLDLHNTQITNAGLEHLKGLIKLDQLDIRGTKITYTGVMRLKQSLPNCSISQ